MRRGRFILHADMDAFYASVEQRDHPDLRGKPVIVGARGARGVVSAASYEARAFGVRSAMPGFQARKLCPHGIFVDGDMKKYAAVSRRVHSVFEEFSDQIEPLALDEAFIDITGSLNLFGEPMQIGKLLKERVWEEVGLVVSVGIGPNKLLSKMACSDGKPNGLLVVHEDEVSEFLAKKPIRALFGIGPKTADQLTRMGISTLGQLGQSSLHLLWPVFGEQAVEMRARARGIDERPVESSREPKSIGEEATFSENVTDHARITSAIFAHSEVVAARARRSGFRGTTVCLKVKLARRKAWGEKAVANHELFPILNRQVKLGSATCDGLVISHAAAQLFEKLQLREGIRLVGVTLTGLVREEQPKQLDLFSAAPKGPVRSSAHLPKKAGELDDRMKRDRSRGEQLGAALDQISARFGADAVVRGTKPLEKITASDKLKLGEMEAAPEDDRQSNS